VRSDSDLFTYGYRFKPWRGPSIAAGKEILTYLDEVWNVPDFIDTGLGCQVGEFPES
jgi:monooxygenase